MSFSYIGSASASGAGVTSLSCNRPAGAQTGHFLVAVYAFEGVAPGSGPWIIPNNGQFPGNTIGPGEGWLQACWLSPSATGAGIEVWVAINGGVNPFVAQCVAAQNVVAVAAAYSGEYNPTGTITGSPPRVATTARVVGNDPAAPSVSVSTGELVLAVGADAMGAGGFGAPSGMTARVDVSRSGAGTVEAVIADLTAVAPGVNGPFTFPQNAASSTTAGVTATLVIVPAPSAGTSGGVIDAPLPENLDVGQGYTIRVTAVDPTTGALVPGVNASAVVLTADQASVNAGGGGGEGGEWLLVPGPGA